MKTTIQSHAGAALRRKVLAQAVVLALASGTAFGQTTITVGTTGGAGIGTTGAYDDETVKLNAANATAVKAQAGATVGFDRGTVANIATATAAASGQTGLLANGGAIAADSAAITLLPKTGAGAVVTANNMAGVAADNGGIVSLTGTTVTMGGGPSGSNNNAMVATGALSVINFDGGAISTVSKGSIGATAKDGAAIHLSGKAGVSTTGANSTTTGSHGLLATGAGSTVTGSTISVNTTGAQANGARAENGGRIELTDSTVATNTAAYGHGLVAAGGSAKVSGGSITTGGKGAVGAWAKDGGTIALDGTHITTSGAALSATTPPTGEKALSLSHGLLATGADSAISGSHIDVASSAGSASGARAEDGATITLSDSVFALTGAAPSTAPTAVLHALGGGRIDGTGLDVSSSGNLVSGARADGAGSSVALRASSLRVGGDGNVVNAAAGARAIGGGSVTVEDSSLSVHGTYGHGVSAEGAGSNATVSHTAISVDGNRSSGVSITGGAAGALSNSSVALDAGGVGPWAPGVLVDGASSTLQISDSDVRTSPKTSHGMQVKNGADVTVTNGRITTSGNYSIAISAGNSTVTANNVAIETSGNDNAMGIAADFASTVTVHGGSVKTTGNGSPVPSNLTFPHALASRNPGALLVADGTSVQTQGTQAYGAAVDDGGSMVLSNLAVKTEGAYSIGLYAGIGSSKPFNVSLAANNITVNTLGDDAAGAMVSRQYKAETATLDLDNATIGTHGAHSHGLQAESGAVLTANRTVASTTGAESLGAIANNTATVRLNVAGIATTGDLAHGVVARQGGIVDATDLVVHASGAQAAALYAQGTDAQPGIARFSNASLNNRDGATIAVAGAADITLNNAIVGGSGQWLNVDSSIASDGSAIPDMGTGQWQGIGRSNDNAGNARIDLAGSVVTGSARAAPGSNSVVTMRDSSIWKLTGSSNLGTLHNLASLIDFSAPSGGVYKTLSVNNYHGGNGTIALNTYLYGDGSPSDRLVIDGGHADGSTNLLIKNAGGAGALTTGNGIMVVDAVGGGTTDAQAFRLLNRVAAGPYEYTLHRASLDASNGEAWYLRSSQDAIAPPDDPKAPPAQPDGPGPTPQVTPNDPAVTPSPQEARPDAPIPRPAAPTPDYRRETTLYSQIPSLALRQSRAFVDTLHERVGEERRRAVDPLPSESVDTYGPSFAWGRLIYEAGDDQRYDYDQRGLQLGTDLYRHEDKDGSTDQAGVEAHFGRIGGDVTHTDGRSAGQDTVNGYGAGAYWTHFWPKGGYLDGQLQLNRYSVRAQPEGMNALKTNGRGVTASLEAGYPYKIDDEKERYLEPQVQVVHSRISLDPTHDAGAAVRFDNAESLAGRLGVRIHEHWYRVDDKGQVYRSNGWIRPSIWHEFRGKTKTEFSSADGYVPFTANLDSTWAELNIGLDREVSETTTIQGSLGYQRSFDGAGRSYGGMIGVKVKF
jgi:outer membrane autotransporter protein